MESAAGSNTKFQTEVALSDHGELNASMFVRFIKAFADNHSQKIIYLCTLLTVASFNTKHYKRQVNVLSPHQGSTESVQLSASLTWAKDWSTSYFCTNLQYANHSPQHKEDNHNPTHVPRATKNWGLQVEQQVSRVKLSPKWKHSNRRHSDHGKGTQREQKRRKKKKNALDGAPPLEVVANGSVTSGTSASLSSLSEE